MSSKAEIVQEIRRTADEKYHHPEKFIWSMALGCLEQDIQAYFKHKQDSLLPDHDRDGLLKFIENNGEFMLAIILNQDHQNVAILPLPEIFHVNERVHLAASPIPVNNRFDSIMVTIEALLEQQVKRPTSGVLENVVVLQQNLGQFRGMNHLEVGFWNTDEATLSGHRAARQYENWILTVCDDLRAVHGKTIGMVQT